MQTYFGPKVLHTCWWTNFYWISYYQGGRRMVIFIFISALIIWLSFKITLLLFYFFGITLDPRFWTFYSKCFIAIVIFLPNPVLSEMWSMWAPSGWLLCSSVYLRYFLAFWHKLPQTLPVSFLTQPGISTKRNGALYLETDLNTRWNSMQIFLKPWCWYKIRCRELSSQICVLNTKWSFYLIKSSSFNSV